MQVRHATITVLDFETTGSVPGFDVEPWQIGMIRICGGRVDPQSAFDRLIRVDINRPFNAYAPGMHHRRREEIARAPGNETVWSEVKDRVCGVPLAAHNCSVEKKFLRRMAPMHRVGPWIDTLMLARQAWPDAPSHKLGALIEGLHLTRRVQCLCPGRDAHDALYDAVACAVLLEHLLTLPGWSDLRLDDPSCGPGARQYAF